MPSFGKKAVAACACALSSVLLFAGCGFTSLLSSNGTVKLSTSDYQSETEINADSLLAVREKIRSFNVMIDTLYYYTISSHSPFGHSTQQTVAESLGSGVIFDEDDSYYYALTNYHVITPIYDGVTYSVDYTVTDINGTQYSGEYLSGSEEDDVAIISLSKSGADSSSASENAVALGKADVTARADTNVCEGELVFAVGNPSGVANVVTYGKIVGWCYIQNVDYAVINHTALISSGNSGGALCDIDGNLLGLNTWGTEGSDEDNFAIPLSILSGYLDEFYASYADVAA